MTQVSDRKIVKLGTLTIPNGSTESASLDLSSLTLQRMTATGDTIAETTLELDISDEQNDDDAVWVDAKTPDDTTITFPDNSGSASYKAFVASDVSHLGRVRISQASDPGADVSITLWGRGVG